jgi:hypothetical protein
MPAAPTVRADGSHQAIRGDPLRPLAAAQQLVRRGLRPAEAANVVAYLVGLAPVERGWTVEEIERLLFVRFLVERDKTGR